MAVRKRVDIYPINFAFADGSIYFRTAPGTKLLELTINAEVAIEIDGYSQSNAWSVVAHGTARRLERQSEIDEAYKLPLRPYIPTIKQTWVRITPTELTGRYFDLGPEPESD